MKQLPSLIFKIIYGCGMYILLLGLSIFIGLFIRYTLIFAYTVFLISFDKCMRDSWGWVHQYLIILYNRFKQNKLTTIKFFIFYVISNIGMYALLAAGSYFILKILLLQMIPFLIPAYTYFFGKTIFFV
jgi:hypothetical protein